MGLFDHKKTDAAKDSKKDDKHTETKPCCSGNNNDTKEDSKPHLHSEADRLTAFLFGSTSKDNEPSLSGLCAGEASGLHPCLWTPSRAAKGEPKYKIIF